MKISKNTLVYNLANQAGIFEVGLMLVFIALAGSTAVRLKKSVIPFYMLAGIFAGPFVAGKISTIYVGKDEIVDHFVKISAELGIIFLLFFLGLEFNISRLVENRVNIGLAGIIDLINLLIGILVGYLIFGALIPAMVLGGVVYISSSAIITKSLVDLNWIANDEAEPILGVLVFEDLFIALYMAFLSILLVTGEDADYVQISGSIILLVGFIVSLILLVYFGTHLFQRSLEVENKELFVLRAVAITVFIAGIALLIGVSEAVAAFFVGMGFSNTEHRGKLEQVLDSLKDVFAAIFFFWIGLKTDPLLFVDIFGYLILILIVTSISKFVTGYSAGKIYKLGHRRSIKTGLGLLSRGEFSLIIASQAAVIRTTEDNTNDTLLITIPSLTVAYVFLMSILGTISMQYSQFFENIKFSSGVIRLFNREDR